MGQPLPACSKIERISPTLRALPISVPPLLRTGLGLGGATTGAGRAAERVAGRVKVGDLTGRRVAIVSTAAAEDPGENPGVDPGLKAEGVADGRASMVKDRGGREWSADAASARGGA